MIFFPQYCTKEAKEGGMLSVLPNDGFLVIFFVICLQEVEEEATLDSRTDKLYLNYFFYSRYFT